MERLTSNNESSRIAAWYYDWLANWLYFQLRIPTVFCSEAKERTKRPPGAIQTNADKESVGGVRMKNKWFILLVLLVVIQTYVIWQRYKAGHWRK